MIGGVENAMEYLNTALSRCMNDLEANRGVYTEIFFISRRALTTASEGIKRIEQKLGRQTDEASTKRPDDTAVSLVHFIPNVYLK